MTTWTATTPEAGPAVGLARHRAGRLAPLTAWLIGGFQGTTMPSTGIDAPNTQPRWLLEMSP
ncbi:MAG: hypothetical protein ACRD0A_07430 [Acidimicrobiales bacterium]